MEWKRHSIANEIHGTTGSSQFMPVTSRTYHAIPKPIRPKFNPRRNTAKNLVTVQSSFRFVQKLVSMYDEFIYKKGFHRVFSSLG